MSEAAQKAAEKYVEETDYIDNTNRRLAGNAFLAGAAWQRERDAGIAARMEHPTSRGWTDGRSITINSCSIAQAIREQTQQGHADCKGCPDCKGVVWNGPGD